MTTYFGDAADWVSDILKNSGITRTITIQDDLDSPTIQYDVQATPGESAWEESGIESVTRIASQDFICDARDIESGEFPKRGWIVIDSLDESKYEVFAPDGEAPWDWCEVNHRRIRIHSQSIERTQ